MALKRITLTEDFSYAVDGFATRTLHAGLTLDEPAEVADLAIAAGAAVEVTGLEDADTSGAADVVTLDDLTVAELKQIAADEGIDLGDAKKKADIVVAINTARAGGEPAPVDAPAA